MERLLLTASDFGDLWFFGRTLRKVFKVEMELSWCDLKLWKKKRVWSFSCWQKIAAVISPATWTGAKWSQTGHGLSSSVLSAAVLPPALLGGPGGGNLSLLPDFDTPGDKETCSCWPRSYCKHTHQNPSKRMHQRILPGQAVLPSLCQWPGTRKGKAGHQLNLDIFSEDSSLLLSVPSVRLKLTSMKSEKDPEYRQPRVTLWWWDTC